MDTIKTCVQKRLEIYSKYTNHYGFSSLPNWRGQPMCRVNEHENLHFGYA